MTAYETKDSGERAEFDSGMQRDTESGKPRFNLMVPQGVPYEEQLLTRVAALLGRGADKYDERNWEQATGEAELERFKSSAYRHFFQWLTGETDEDHAAAVVFNLLGHETTLYKMRVAATTEDVDPEWLEELRGKLGLESASSTLETDLGWTTDGAGSGFVVEQPTEEAPLGKTSDEEFERRYFDTVTDLRSIQDSINRWYVNRLFIQQPEVPELIKQPIKAADAVRLPHLEAHFSVDPDSVSAAVSEALQRYHNRLT